LFILRFGKTGTVAPKLNHPNVQNRLTIALLDSILDVAREAGVAYVAAYIDGCGPFAFFRRVSVYV